MDHRKFFGLMAGVSLLLSSLLVFSAGLADAAPVPLVEVAHSSTPAKIIARLPEAASDQTAIPVEYETALALPVAIPPQIPLLDGPTDISLDSTTVDENKPTGTVVGTFSTTGGTSPYTYTLVSGTGDTDNGSFTIPPGGAVLQTNAVFNYEVKNSYNIRVRTTDSGGLYFEKEFTITVNNVNEAPTALNLSSTSVNENQPVGTTVGTFSTVDPDDPGGSGVYTYTLVSGSGSTDNGSFTIPPGGAVLQTNAVFDRETKSSYNIRVRTTDSGGLPFEREFTITVNNVNEAPTALNLSSTSVNENQPVGTTVGTFSTVDVDSGDSHTYTLVSGSGSTDNGSFTIPPGGAVLQTNAVFDRVVKSSYNIRVRTMDSGGLPFEREFTITVNDVLPAVVVTKTAGPPTSVPETGANVTFTIVVANTSQENFTITSFSDTVFNLNVRCPDWVNAPVAAGGTYVCIFSAFISGDFGGLDHVNAVTAFVKDNENHTVFDSDNASVSFTNVLPNISVTNTPNPAAVTEPGGNVTFNILVTNNGTEVNTLDSLTNDFFGNLNGKGSCSLTGPPTLAANGGTYSCSFTQFIEGNFGGSHQNTVTAQASDDDGYLDTKQATATVPFAELFEIYLPIIRKPGTILSVWNDNTGGNVFFEVLGTGVSCPVPNNTTQFCGTFPPGTYNVRVTSVCGPPATVPKTYGDGPETTRVFCR